MKKIMFNDRYGLTEAVLYGEKTQTRRVYKTPRNSYGGLEVENNCIITFDANGCEIVTSPKYKVGEVVAVAQSYKDAGFKEDKYCIYDYKDDGCIPVYRGDYTGVYIPVALAGWNNKMFVCAGLMPHRIRITDVRVERLQDISDEDCIKEGIGISATDNRIGTPFGIPFNYFVGEDKKGCLYSTPREAYAALIDKISGKGTWESNPYVFVYDFELVK